MEFWIIVKYILSALFIIAAIRSIAKIGEHREPITADDAIGSVILVAIVVATLFH
jgi:hypothetical protein